MRDSRAGLSRKTILDTGNRLVLQYADDDAAVFCLSFGSFVISDLIGLSHGTGCQKTCEGNFSLLKQHISDVIGTVFAELLVSRNAANGRSIPFYLDYISVDSLGFV